MKLFFNIKGHFVWENDKTDSAQLANCEFVITEFAINKETNLLVKPSKDASTEQHGQSWGNMCTHKGFIVQ